MIIPAILTALILGGSFDIYDVRPGVFQIFDTKDIEEHHEITHEIYQKSGYVIPKTTSEIDEFLELDPSLALKSRLGDVRFLGMDRYLSSVVNRLTTVDIVMRVFIHMETRSFPSTTKQETRWQNRPQKLVGTHYINSTHYGGELFISYQLIPNKHEYVDEVRQVVDSSLGRHGELDDHFFENFFKVVQKLEGKFRPSIQVSGTGTGFFTGPRNVAEIQKLVNEFPQTLKTKGKGSIVRIELEDLATIHPSYSPFKVNHALYQHLKEANEMFDDIRVTFEEFKEWQDSVTLNDDEDKTANDFYKKITSVRQSLLHALRNVNVTGSEHQLDEAFEEYSHGPYAPYFYLKQLMHMINTFGKHF